MNTKKNNLKPSFTNLKNKPRKISLAIFGLSVVSIFGLLLGGFFLYQNQANSQDEAKASAIYTCPAGFTGPNASNQCTQAALPVCPTNYTFSSGQCRISYTPTYTCPSGFTSNGGGGCTATGTFQGCQNWSGGAVSPTYVFGSPVCVYCPGQGGEPILRLEYIGSSASFFCSNSTTCARNAPSPCSTNASLVTNPNFRCPNGTIQGFDTCSISASVSCPQGGSFGVGGRCTNAISPTSYSCSQGIVSGTNCLTPATISDYTVVTDSDIATVSCTPVVGVLGYTVSCSVTTTSPVKGNITFSTGTPGTGSCIATFTPGTTSANCSFPTTNPGLFPVTVTSSGGGTRTIPSITVQCAANSYLSGTTCTPCPTGATSVAGSTSLSQCTCPTGFVLNSGSTACIPASCPNGATNPLDTPPCTICPAGYELQGGQCKLIITIADISPSYDCIESKMVVIGTVYTCNFNVSGSGVLPSSGVIARTEKGGVFSNPNLPAECTLNSSVNPQVLTCTNIKTDNGLTPGKAEVALKVGSTGTFTDKGDVTLVKTITPLDVENSLNCIDSLIVIIPATFDCSFKVIGTGPYILSPGTFAKAETTPNGSNGACSYNDSTLTILCTGLPSLGGTPRIQNVLLALGGLNPIDKGGVTLARNLTPTDLDNSGDCTQTLSVTIGDKYNCTFPINTTDEVVVPPNTTASTGTATGVSDNCVIIVRSDGKKLLSCSNIPTTNGTPGIQDVLVNIPGNNPTPKGKVNLLPIGPLLIESVNANFTPTRSASKQFKTGGDLSINVSDSRIVSGASCVFSYSGYPNKSNTTTNYINLGSNPVIYSNSAQATLLANQQLIPKWRFKVDCTNPTTATNGYAGRVFTAYPDYSFKYGAIVTIDIGGSVF